MIRLLTEADRQTCLEFVSARPAENLFIIGDIEAFGFASDFQEVWGDFTSEKQLRAVLLRYYQNYIVYAPGAFDTEGMADIIRNDARALMVSGLKSIVAQVTRTLKAGKTPARTLYYAKCEDGEQLDATLDISQVKEAALSDVDRLLQLHGSIPEFADAVRNKESVRHAMRKGVARTYYIEEGELIASSASTTAENSYAAMIIGVCTRSDYKKKGYATRCLTKLVQALMAENKAACLFYDNPEAGKIYKRLGFVDIDQWTLYYLQ
ncbi:N-acetyltransferase [Pullulanibacillus camelliae]|uniref:N-acetyltransferase n=1 Tax=Pullulanibacillus camelliae TaxID=1707096 RepID=A0A8J2YKM1_9BACL|nr:GNAT family N-acetyltransferase [Pullulanibacillus camelliae]GGE50190.1 N-acetyltransferase [Pullulanibacillus camelliae]